MMSESHKTKRGNIMYSEIIPIVKFSIKLSKHV